MIGGSASAEGVNAVLGDESYVARFGVAPDASVDEDVRLRVHLEYVLERLRAVDVSASSAAQRRERARNLERLAAYIERGEFPRNYEVKGRRPHFIDDDGRICAVGYLIEQSAGRAAAEAINARHEWDYIPDIDGIDAWVDASGLTRIELAMIQPGYGWRPRPDPEWPERPMPPPPDETFTRRNAIIAALGNVHGNVQACADRFEVSRWVESLHVVVTVRRFAVDVTFGRAGGRGFRRCVQRVLDNAVAGQWFTRRTGAMNVDYTFTLAEPVEDVEWRDDRWSKPPPY